MFCIARPVDGCGLNGREYLLDERNRLILFSSESAMREHLLRAGVTKDDLDAFEYLIAEEEFPGADIFNLVLER